MATATSIDEIRKRSARELRRNQCLGLSRVEHKHGRQVGFGEWEIQIERRRDAIDDIVTTLSSFVDLGEILGGARSPVNGQTVKNIEIKHQNWECNS